MAPRLIQMQEKYKALITYYMINEFKPESQDWQPELLRQVERLFEDAQIKASMMEFLSEHHSSEDINVEMCI